MARPRTAQESKAWDEYYRVRYDENDQERIVLQVTGDRNWGELSFQFIYDVFKVYDDVFDHKPVLLNGAAPGVDLLAGDAGLSLDWNVVWCPAEWESFGRGAGPVRNGHMLSFAPAILFVFHNALHRSKGTLNCVEQALQVEFPPRVYLYSDLRPTEMKVITPNFLDEIKVKGAKIYA